MDVEKKQNKKKMDGWMDGLLDMLVTQLTIPLLFWSRWHLVYKPGLFLRFYFSLLGSVLGVYWGYLYTLVSITLPAIFFLF